MQSLYELWIYVYARCGERIDKCEMKVIELLRATMRGVGAEIDIYHNRNGIYLFHSNYNLLEIIARRFINMIKRNELGKWIMIVELTEYKSIDDKRTDYRNKTFYVS